MTREGSCSERPARPPIRFAMGVVKATGTTLEALLTTSSATESPKAT